LTVGSPTKPLTRAVGRLIEKNHLEYLNISILKRS
jgi:hypothetical protein